MGDKTNDSTSGASAAAVAETTKRKPFTKQAAESAAAGEKMAVGNTQQRGAGGQYGGKKSYSLSEAKKMLGDTFDRGSGKKLPAETDGKALDEVKPGGKDSETESARASKKSDAAADEGAHAESSQKDKPAAADSKELARAKEVLKRRWGYTEDDFKLYADNPQRLIELGSKAHAQDVAESMKGREKAKTDADKGADAAGDDQGDDPDEGADDPDADDLEADRDVQEALKHFSGYDRKQVEPWVKTINAYMAAGTKRTQAAIMKAAEAHIEKRIKALNAEITQLINAGRAEAEFDRTCETLKADYPEIDTDEGRLELAKAIGERRAGGNKESVRALVHAQAKALWSDARAKRIEEQKRQDELDSAKDNGTVAVSTRTKGGARKGSNGKELLGEAFDRASGRR